MRTSPLRRGRIWVFANGSASSPTRSPSSTAPGCRCSCSTGPRSRRAPASSPRTSSRPARRRAETATFPAGSRSIRRRSTCSRCCRRRASSCRSRATRARRPMTAWPTFRRRARAPISAYRPPHCFRRAFRSFRPPRSSGPAAPARPATASSTAAISRTQA